LTVYIAGQYARRDEFREVVKRLREELHFTVTSRWLDETEPLNLQMGQHSEDFYRITAAIDLQDIAKSDAILFFSEDPLVGVIRGGRHVEFGYALAKGKTIFVVGPRENVFHYVPGVTNFLNVDEFITNHLHAYQFLLNSIRVSNPGITEERIYLAKRQMGIEWFKEAVPEGLEGLESLQEKGGTDIFG